MNKYDNLQSKSEYINYTIANFLRCYDDLSVEDIPLFTELFRNLQNHKISIGNYLVDGMPLQGVKLDIAVKDKHRDCDDLVGQLETISNFVTSDDKKDFLFFQCISHLCSGISRLDNLEMMHLNNLFQTVNNRKQSISSDTINNGESFFFPYKRYPQKRLK